MVGHRRVVQTVTPQDAETEGRPYLYEWLADLAGVSEQTVWRAVKDGSPASPNCLLTRDGSSCRARTRGDSSPTDSASGPPPTEKRPAMSPG
jgi:hypothetical protein